MNLVLSLFSLKYNVLEIQKQHEKLIDEQQTILEDADESDNMLFQKQRILQELQGQWQTFQYTISYQSCVVTSTVEEARGLFDRLNREIARLKARLPIYTQYQQLIDTIKSNRIVILKADTGSGKSTQLVQYLDEAGFSYDGLSIQSI